MNTAKRKIIISLIFCSMIMGSTATLRCDNVVTNVVSDVTDVITKKPSMVTAASQKVISAIKYLVEGLKTGTLKITLSAKDGAIKIKDLTKDGVLKTIECIKNGTCTITPSKESLTVAATVLFILAVFRFNSKEKQDAPRYDFSKMSPINFKEFVKQLWYLIDDGLIGQSGSKAYLMSDKDNGGKIYAGRSSKSMGLGGQIAKYAKPIQQTYAIISSLLNLSGTLDKISKNIA